MHQHVEPIEPFDGELDDVAASRPRLQILVAGHRGPAPTQDVPRHAVCHRRVGAATVGRDSGIVHHHRSPPVGKQSGIGGAQAAAGTGHDRHLPVESDPSEGRGGRHRGAGPGARSAPRSSERSSSAVATTWGTASMA